MLKKIASLISPGLLLLLSCATAQESSAPGSNPAAEKKEGFPENNVIEEIQTLIPKREMGVLDFLEQHPEYDGRGVVIAIFDTGVDPGTADLQVTTTGEHKILDVIDASGAGDVDMTTTATLSDAGTLSGLTGRDLVIPEEIKNPSGEFRLGWKSHEEIFTGGVTDRVQAQRKKRWEARYRRILAERIEQRKAAEEAGERPPAAKPESELTLAERDLLARERVLEELEKSFVQADPGPVYDCVLWHDGEHWNALVDTDEDGDMTDEARLRPYGIAHEYADFGEDIGNHFAIQVYEEGDILSIVTVSGAHGTHVASIATGHNPGNPDRNGIAPGARVLSIRIGDLRMGGASNGTGEMRAVAACAKYGVDLMNASWGGSSVYQDGSDWGCEIYTKLVEDYGVTAFVSAGNNGPALSTLGSPGGECPAVIGVGAYVSDEMARVLHAVRSDVDSTAYQFTSRGPTKGGDLGVDIFGPGGAVASTSFESLAKSRFMNGTSMASPSVAGVGALLVSAAKGEDLGHSPARIRTALMNTAQPVEDVAVFAQGSGLAQIARAYEHLKAHQNVDALDVRWEIKTDDNDLYPGPGLYLRRPVEPGELEVRFTVEPLLPETAPLSKKFDFEEDVILQPTVDWIEVPRFLHLTNAMDVFRPLITIPEPPETGSRILYGEIQAWSAEHPEAGQLFRIPVTIVQPMQVSGGVHPIDRFDAEMIPGTILRRFYDVPAGATEMLLRLRLDPKERNSRLMLLHAISLATQARYFEHETQHYIRLNPGEEVEYTIPVLPGRTTELCLLQVFFSLGKSLVEGEVEFLGIETKDDQIVMAENEKFGVVELFSALGDPELDVSANIKNAVHRLIPVSSEIVPLDERDVFPPAEGDELFLPGLGLLQKFEMSLEEPLKVEFTLPESHGIPAERLAGGFTQVFHESGKLIWQGSIWRAGGIELSKGKNTIYRMIRALERDDLEAVRDHVLLAIQPLKAPASLTVYENGADALNGKPATAITFRHGRDYAVYIEDKAVGALADIKPEPDWFTGSFELKHEDDVLLEVPIHYRAGQKIEFDKREKTGPSKPKKKAPVEKLEDDLFDRRLEFVESLRGDEDGVTTRSMVLMKLLDERPENPRLYLEKAWGLAVRGDLVSEWHGGKPEENGKEQEEEEVNPGEVLELLDKARELSRPDEVALFFGAKPAVTPGDKQAEEELSEREKELKAHRERLAQIARLRSDVLLHLERTKEARAALLEAARWEDTPSEDTKRQQMALYEAESYIGLALEQLENDILKDNLFDKELREKRIEYYETLGWDEFAERERLRLNLWKHQPQPTI